MKNILKNKMRSIKTSMTTMFTRKKSKSTAKMHPDEYFRQIFFTKKNFIAIAYLAEENKKAKKKWLTS